MLDEAMIRATGEDVVTEELYKRANVTKSPYQGGTFQGNECRRLVQTAASRGWSGAHPLAVYSPLFLSLDRVYTEVFSCKSDLQYSELQGIKHAMQDFVNK